MKSVENIYRPEKLIAKKYFFYRIVSEVSMKRTLLLIAILIIVPLTGYAKEAVYPLTGTFSDMKCVPEEGDVLGVEITILAGLEESRYRYFALVQFSEGTAGIPQFVPLEIDGSKISFKTDYLGQFIVSFSGYINKERIVGRLGKPLNLDVNLPRRSSFWQAPGDLCFR